MLIFCVHACQRFIDTAGVQCLNEKNPGSILKVFKAWENRLDKTEVHHKQYYGDELVCLYN